MTPAPSGWIYVAPTLVCLISGWFGIWSLKTGKTRLRSGKWITRAEEPLGFWTNVACLLILSAGMLSLMIYFLLKPN